jgi:hypothetical protein
VINTKSDDPAGTVDPLDRLSRHEPAAAGEEAGADGQRVRNIRRSAVHQALDAADDPPTDVGNRVADRSPKIGERRFAHDEDSTRRL